MKTSELATRTFAGCERTNQLIISTNVNHQDNYEFFLLVASFPATSKVQTANGKTFSQASRDLASNETWTEPVDCLMAKHKSGVYKLSKPIKFVVKSPPSDALKVKGET